MKRLKLFTSWLPGVVLVGERYCANALADKVNWEGHREESLHRARVEVQLLERDGETRLFGFLSTPTQEKSFRKTIKNSKQ